ncbi:MATE family efflux transporter [Tepidibacter thalassicus]|uniref:Probable multidrug resistance protein NorM n=1 Tax=Tepidibacter thalassicus DSM 15285 TaxID=1123350 RepID=A0A1M5QTU2_9FIRM|nr:MATE family efflux transporter [Tepidibacter thalassicus]SHH17286.1 putative efflux protein, MATE family [Tepidibacter thalassicus DSM 15285]
MINSIFKDNKFYKNMLLLAIPIALQNLITSSLNMIDTVMIGKLGENQIASVGIANQVFFLYVIIIFGINSGASMFISQFWGKKDIDNIRKTLSISITSGLILSLIFLTLVLFGSDIIINIFTRDKEVVDFARRYLKIVCISYPITAISFAYGFSCRSINRAVLPMIVSAICIFINASLNYMLIFGNFGFHQMGVVGAALATLISRTIEMAIILVYVYKKDHPLKVSIDDFKSVSINFIKTVLKKSTPVILNDAFWALGMVMYSIAYAKVGTRAIAATQISNTIQNFFMVVSMGLANACAVMLGNEIGANNEDTAVEYSKKFSILGFATGGLVGLILYLLIPLILSVFNISTDLYKDVAKILIILSIFMSLKTYNVILIVGILRSGGDNKFSLYLEMGSVWLIGVPLAFLGAFLKYPIYVIVFLVYCEEIVKGIIGFLRVASKKWVNNIVAQI